MHTTLDEQGSTMHTDIRSVDPIDGDEIEEVTVRLYAVVRSEIPDIGPWSTADYDQMTLIEEGDGWKAVGLLQESSSPVNEALCEQA